MKKGGHLLEQLVLTAGFRQEIVGPALQGDPTVVIQGASRQCNDNRFFSAGIPFYSASRLYPVHDRHMHIHQDQPWVPFLPVSDGSRAVSGAAYGKPNSSQQFHEPVPVLKLIVDHQNFGSLRSGAYAHDPARSAASDGYRGVAAFDRDIESEYRSPAGAARDREIAAHQPRVLAADGQSQAGPLLGVEALFSLAERLEQLFQSLARNARTSVLNAGRQPQPIGVPLVQSDAQLDLAALGKLDGVSEKVDQRLADLAFVRRNVRHGFPIDRHFESQGFGLGPQAEHRREIGQ